MKVIEILPNRTGKVRDRLCIEDVRIPEYEVLSGFGLVKTEIINGERVLWFKEPIRVPRFNIFYASRISNVGDPYMLELIKRLLYLNPKPDALMVKKITEFIILRFSRFKQVESEIKVGEMIAKPMLRFEDVEPIVQTVANNKRIMREDYQPDNEIPVLFQRDSEFTRETKVRILAEYRGYRVKDMLENAIHSATEMLIDTKNHLTVTKTRIRSTGEVVTDRGVASVNTIGKYMGERTRKIMEEHNEGAPFRTEHSAKKFEKFLELPESTVEEYSKKLNISKSTVMEFKALKKTLDRGPSY